MKNEIKNTDIKNLKLYNRCKHLHPTVAVLLLCCFVLLIFFVPSCNADTVVEIGDVNTPQSAVIFIIDGLSSCYVYPEYTPHAIDGSVLDKAKTPNIKEIFNNSCRVLDIKAPQTFTEGGHSVLVTGYSKADSEIAGAHRTTIYDVAHENGYLTFAIMQKGDSTSICKKQNVIIHDTENSVNEPEMVTSVNDFSKISKHISLDVADILQEQSVPLQEYLNQYPEGSQERYDAYNNWAIKTGYALIEFMSKEYPEQKYLLTINVGAIDSAGHYKKDSGYIASIEGIDNATADLYKKCIENNIAFLLTADHGMAFPSVNSRGGHQSDKYSVMTESQKVPLIISATDVDTGIIKGEFGQEDIAPTILEILNMPGELRVADSKAITVKDYVNIRVNVPEEGEILLIKDENVLYKNIIQDNVSFMGLEANTDYTLKYSSLSKPEDVIEKLINDETSTIVNLINTEQSTSNKSYQNPRYITGGVLIIGVNLAGLALIRKVLKE